MSACLQIDDREAQTLCLLLVSPLYAPLWPASLWRLESSSSWTGILSHCTPFWNHYSSSAVSNSSSSVPFCPFNWKFNDQDWQPISVQVLLLVCPSVVSVVYYLPAGVVRQAVCLAHTVDTKVGNGVTDIFSWCQSIEIDEVKGTVFRVGHGNCYGSIPDQRRDGQWSKD